MFATIYLGLMQVGMYQLLKLHHNKAYELRRTFSQMEHVLSILVETGAASGQPYVGVQPSHPAGEHSTPEVLVRRSG